MTIEKLTDVEAYNVEHCSGAGGAKALRIIDQLTAECERLRAELEGACVEAGVQRSLTDAASRWRAKAERMHDTERARAAAAESRLAAANALLKRVHAWDARQEKREVGEAFVNIMCDVDRHLAGQEPVATRTEAEQRVLDACEAWHVLEIGPREDGSRMTVYGDPLPVARAELARRGLKST